MKKLFLALLFCAVTAVAMPHIEKAGDHKEAVQDKIQHPPKPPRPHAPPSRATLERRRAQIDARRDADVKTAKKGIKKAASDIKKKLRSHPHPPHPPHPPRR